MIGRVEDIAVDSIILEVNQIAYEIATSRYSMSHFQVGESYKVYTYLQVREDGLYLYGFYSQEEKELFLLLTRVSTIGPKSALAILSALSVDEIYRAILASDMETLTKAPGVGKKTAGRILLELLEPVQKMNLDLPQKSQDLPRASEEISFALEALINLGFPRNEAQKALASTSKGLSVEELIKQALQKLS